MSSEQHQGTAAISAKNRREWRRWLERHHTKAKSVWLIIYHKSSEQKSVYYDEAVEEALCFGWIDSIAHKRDHESKYQFFSKRKEKSNWSKVNKERAERMLAQGLMTSAGQALIDLAKKTGTWEALREVQNSIIPADLQQALGANKKAAVNFEAFPPSSKRIILEWILNARRSETREKRIRETVELAAKNIRANHYRQ